MTKAASSNKTPSTPDEKREAYKLMRQGKLTRTRTDDGYTFSKRTAKDT